MSGRSLNLVILALLLAAASGAAMAGDDITIGKTDSAWNVTVEGDADKKEVEETSETLRLRVFDDVDRLPPDEYPGFRRPGIAVDVEAEMVTCPDGNTRVEKVNVGGKDFDLEGECLRAYKSSNVSVTRGSAESASEERTNDAGEQ